MEHNHKTVWKTFWILSIIGAVLLLSFFFFLLYIKTKGTAVYNLPAFIKYVNYICFLAVAIFVYYYIKFVQKNDAVLSKKEESHPLIDLPEASFVDHQQRSQKTATTGGHKTGDDIGYPEA